MENVKKIKIRCLHCSSIFNSPIFFDQFESFETCTLIGNIVQCPTCNEMTGCNKKNMSIKFEGGGFVGFDS